VLKDFLLECPLNAALLSLPLDPEPCLTNASQLKLAADRGNHSLISAFVPKTLTQAAWNTRASFKAWC
jgi:hypothetical protein